MKNIDTIQWDYAMSGDELEAVVAEAKSAASNSFAKLAKIGVDGWSENFWIELSKIKERIFDEKDKTEEYWDNKITELMDALENKYGKDLYK